MGLIVVAGAVFTGFILGLVAVLLAAKRWVIGGGRVHIVVNDDESNAIDADRGGTLLAVLRAHSVLVPAACGGKGSCGMCRVMVCEGGGDLTPAERSHIGPAQAREGERLACMVRLRQDLRIRVPAEILSIRQWRCRVRSNRSVATYIKELVLETPPGEDFEFRAGGYVLVHCEPYRLSFRDLEIGEPFRPEWDEQDLWRFTSVVREPVTRAYSMANHPGEEGIVMLNVRIATPPPQAPRAPPGQVSSWLFGLRPGDEVTISGPYGEFHVREGDREMIFVGGGAGMAPLRSLILDQLERVGTRRRMSFFYGARSLREAYYVGDFDGLAATHDNFHWQLVLSEPRPGDGWEGATGFVHDVLYRGYLATHPAPEKAEYYLCGPPAMMSACFRMLDDLGVDPESVFFDDFGG